MGKTTNSSVVSNGFEPSLPNIGNVDLGPDSITGEIPQPADQAQPQEPQHPQPPEQPAQPQPRSEVERPSRIDMRDEPAREQEPAKASTMGQPEPRSSEPETGRTAVPEAPSAPVAMPGSVEDGSRHDTAEPADDEIGLLSVPFDSGQDAPTEPDTPSAEPDSAASEPKSDEKPSSIKQNVDSESVKTGRKPVSKIMEEMADFIMTDPMPKTKYDPKADTRPLVSYSRPAEAIKEAKSEERRAAKAAGRGNGVAGQMTSDPNMELTDISFGDHEYRMAIQYETSPLRKVVAQYAPDADIDLMAENADYCFDVLNDIFEKNDIPFLCIKYPTPSSADQHVRYAKIHHGDSARLHPLSLKVFNADADGDVVYMSFNEKAKYGINYAMDFLIGDDNQIKIDDSIFDFRKWWSDGNDDPVSTVRELLSEHVSELSGFDGRSIRPIAEGIVDVVNGDNDGFKKIFYAIRQLSVDNASTPKDADMLASSILKGIWNYNRLYWDATVFNSLYETEEYEYSEDRFEGLDEFDKPATAPSNFFDYQRLMRQPIGFIKGKNPQFRFAAAAAKPINAVKGIVFGKRKWSDEDGNKWKNDVDEIIAMQMSGLAGLREQQYYPVVWVRSKVMREVGSPRAYKDLDAFIQAFAKIHRKYHYISDMANVFIRNEYTMISANRKQWKYSSIENIDNIEDVANAFKQIYGDMEMGVLFKNPPAGSKHMTLNQYIGSTRTKLFTQEQRDQNKKKATTEATFIHALVNIRTKRINKVHNDFVETCQKFFDKDGKSLFKKAYSENTVEGYYSAASEAMYQAYFAMGQGAFDRLGMNTLGHMIKNDLGVAILNAKNPEELGGLLYEVYARNKLLDLYRYQKKGKVQKFAEELDRIARSSDTWRAIAVDIRNANSTFKMITQKADLANGKLIPGESTVTTPNGKLWKSVADKGNIVDAVLFNRDLDMYQKEALLNDFQKASPRGNRFQQPWAVTMEILSSPEQISPGIGAQTDFDRTDAFDWIKAASSHIDAGISEFHSAMVGDVGGAFKELKDEGKLDIIFDYLDAVASGEVNLVEVSVADYADAVTAMMDPTYRSSEKSQQEPAINNLFTSLSYAINGKLASDLELADDVSLGKMAYDRFIRSPMIVAKVLTGQIKELEVYDGHGSQKVSRESFLGKNPSTYDVWHFMFENPRIAMSLRMASAVPSSEIDDGTSLVANRSLSESMRAFSTARAKKNALMVDMMNHPVFGGLVALTVNMTGKKQNQAASEVRKNAEILFDNLWYLADQWQDQNVADNVRTFIVEPLSKDLEKLRDEVLWTNTEDNAVDLLYGYIQNNITSYIMEIQEKGVPYSGPAPADISFKVRDTASVEAFFHVTAALSGAQTSVSTSINGGESRRNALLATVAAEIEEECDSPAVISMTIEDFNRDWKKYVRYKIAGANEYVTPANAFDIMSRAINDGLETIELEDPAGCTADSPCVCKRHMTMDPSTVNTGKVTTPVSRYMLTKRADGTEALNLKRKKEGDDGTDRIVKTKISDVLKFMEQEDPVGKICSDPSMSMDKARKTLASYLKQVNDSMSYKDMSESDYMNIAQFMVRQNPETGEKYIASLEELAMLVTNEIHKAYIASNRKLNSDDVLNIGRTAINSYAGQNLLYDSEAMNYQVNVIALRKDLSYRVISQRMSSAARNVELINDVMSMLVEESKNRRFSNRVVVTSTKMLKAVDQKLRAKTKIKVPGYFNLVGRIGTQDIAFAPGPQNVWLVENEASVKDITDAMKNGKRYCVNMIVNHFDDNVIQALVNTGNADQLIKLSETHSLVPFFDMRLNGPNTSGSNGAFNVGVCYIDESNVVRIAEDAYNTEGLTDSEMQGTKGIERVNVDLSGVERIGYEEMFPNIVKKFGPSSVQLNLPTRNEITDLLTSVEFFQDGFFETWFDPGYVIGKDFKFSESEKNAIRKYKMQLDMGNVDETGWLTGIEVEPGDVIGFARVYVNTGKSIAQKWAPVKAFDLNRTGKRAAQSIVYGKIGFDSQMGFETSGTLSLEWSHTGGILGHTAKIFEGPFAANKFILRSELPKVSPERKLKNGWDVDGYIASFSTENRRAGYLSNQLMATLMAEARLTKKGYNFAELSGVMPNDPELKEALRTGTAGFDMWEKSLPTLEFFPKDYPDRFRMNAFCRQIANKALQAGINPLHVFASHFEGVPSKAWFRFEAVVNGSGTFQDNLMEFFHFIDPTLCPKNRSDRNIERTLFNNQLQMLVPFAYPDGELFYGWANVFTGLHFMDAHYSGSGTAGRTAIANRSLSIDVTTMYAGRYLVPEELYDMVNHATRSYSANLSSFMMVNEDNPEAEVDSEV